jgi:hypothetical protein
MLWVVLKSSSTTVTDLYKCTPDLISSYIKFRLTKFLNSTARIEVVTFSKSERNFSSRDWKSNETKVTEEYCWAITQAVVRESCGFRNPLCLSLDFNRTPLYTPYTQRSA